MSILLLNSCEKDSEESVDVIEMGNIQGKVTHKELGSSIAGASVEVDGKIVLTNGNGVYSLEGIEFSDNLVISATAPDYLEYKDAISLDQELLIFDISLVPIESPSAEVLEALEEFSKNIEALDPEKIPSLQSSLSEDYKASDNEATAFGVFAGVVPPNYEKLPETVSNIVEKYDKLSFKFADPNVELTGDVATVLMRFEVYAETKPPEPKKWDIALNGKLELQKQNGDWKINYWELTEILKFDWEAL